ncbi:TPA: twin-arginine translocation signal domain-containing protein [Campylobacter jejuni]|nr:twin-arginine translocation signal domain-containing protein [Campylobacter jejuni]EIF6439196.1 twin-arginine translocation signal domain-containing protein [Campylobacter jejuni]ELS5657815.1 twin-arginine translocation signal domain-containing protein [Campylobacter jejuni]EME5044273.1 twin-arginine translocation signal domain-containing protein [Campylobacter jejuni]HEB7718907.1 twin-arginine translocation signal domain-containing protein [Campylobacter jejuni]
MDKKQSRRNFLKASSLFALVGAHQVWFLLIRTIKTI